MIERVFGKRKRSLPNKIRKLDDDAWLGLLIQSVSTRTLNDVEFPGFPPADLQVRFVGASYEETLREAFSFYAFVKRSALSFNKPIRRKTRFLDFGCGWGRFLRFFWKDIDEENLYGCDVNAEILEVCQQTRVPGKLSLITPEGNTPFPEGYFDLIIAYSVFTHLPKKIHLHWMRELARIGKPGCLFFLTLEPRRFIEFIGNIEPNDQSEWHRLLSQFSNQTASLYEQFDAGEFVYLPTYGEEIGRHFGDAIVPLSFIEREWSPFFSVKEYIDDPSRFWQAVLLLQRK